MLALAGVGIDEASTPALSVGEEQLLDEYRQLTAEQRRLLLQLAKEMTGVPVTPTIHVGRQTYDAESAPR